MMPSGLFCTFIPQQQRSSCRYASSQMATELNEALLHIERAELVQDVSHVCL
jgi:hypothetical protein